MATGVVPAGRDLLIAGNPPSGLGGGDGHPTNPLAGIATPRREEGRAHRTGSGGRGGGEQTAVTTA
jgi:hypothetical protein